MPRTSGPRKGTDKATPVAPALTDKGLFPDLQEFIRQANRMTDMAELNAVLPDVTRTLGFEYFAVVHHVDLAISRPGYVRLTNFPHVWWNRYLEGSYFAEDPVFAACEKSVSGFLWSDVANIIDLSVRQKEILLDAAKAGLGAGFTVPAHIPGEYNGSFSFSAGPGKAIKPYALPAAQYVGSFSFEAARRIVMSGPEFRGRDEAQTIRLTQRQFDCVVLAAKGKTDWEIAQLLGISQETVHQHIETAKRRFGVATRMQLVVRTLFNSQLTFSDILR